jgi:putative ABC transport system substrate-binding protein
MRRREFIAIIAGTAAAWPLAARAQQPERMRRIGLLTSLNEGDPRAQAGYMAFRRRLQELGWSVGRHLQIEHRWAGGNPDLLRDHAAELVALKPDALHVFSSPAAVALQQETRSIPIVFVSVSDPIGSGLLQSLAHPGGNATGWTNYVPTMPGKWLQLVKEIAPTIKRAVALLCQPFIPTVT